VQMQLRWLVDGEHQLEHVPLRDPNGVEPPLGPSVKSQTSPATWAASDGGPAAGLRLCERGEVLEPPAQGARRRRQECRHHALSVTVPRTPPVSRPWSAASTRSLRHRVAEGGRSRTSVPRPAQGGSLPRKYRPGSVVQMTAVTARRVSSGSDASSGDRSRKVASEPGHEIRRLGSHVCDGLPLRPSTKRIASRSAGALPQAADMSRDTRTVVDCGRAKIRFCTAGSRAARARPSDRRRNPIGQSRACCDVPIPEVAPL
jgi:hypothetical protein